MNKNRLHLKKNRIGYFSLTMLALSATIGSGWFFGAYKAAKFAGPASIVSWIIGGFAVLLIVLTVLEVGTMFPKAGGLVHYLNITHGPIAGFMSAFACWLVVSSVITFEAAVTTQFLATFKFSWSSMLINNYTHEVTATGMLVAAVLILVYFYINYWTFSFFIKCSNVITVFKLIVPVVTAFTLIIAGFLSPSPTPIKSSFAPYGWSAAFTAITSCGIIFSYNGFQSILSLVEEAKDPEESLPIAIIGTIVFSIILYVLLQIAFIIAVTPDILAIKDWHYINFNSPFAQLAMAFNLNFVMVMIYADTIVSPSGTGIIHTAAASRMFYGMSKYKQMPKFVEDLNPRYCIPRKAMIANLIISLLMLFLFREWSDLLGAISVACIITYIAGPIATSTLRKDAPDLKRPFYLPFEKIISPLAFVLCTLFLYWANWEQISLLLSVLFAGLIIYIIFGYRNDSRELLKNINSSLWMIIYFIVINFLSLIGCKEFGGIGYLLHGYDTVLIVLVALFFFYWAKRSGCYKAETNTE
jgi:amino acid transporter